MSGSNSIFADQDWTRNEKFHSPLISDINMGLLCVLRQRCGLTQAWPDTPSGDFRVYTNTGLFRVIPVQSVAVISRYCVGLVVDWLRNLSSCRIGLG